jgi:hypothetical protein
MKGDLDIVTINCDLPSNTCQVPVKAPGFALVFLTDSPSVHDEAPVTFATSAQTRTINTVSVDPDVLATSNGKSGKERALMGSTSKGSVSGAVGLRALVPGVAVLLAMLGGATLVAMGIVH